MSEKVTKKEYEAAKKVVQAWETQELEKARIDLEKCRQPIEALLKSEGMEFECFQQVVLRNARRYEVHIKYGEATRPIHLEDPIKEIGRQHNIHLSLPYYYYGK